MKESLNKQISTVIGDRNIVEKLTDNKIEFLYDLCDYSRMELSEKGLNNNQINKIIVSLQLQGFDLKPNHAKKNALVFNN